MVSRAYVMGPAVLVLLVPLGCTIYGPRVPAPMDQLPADTAVANAIARADRVRVVIAAM